MRRWDLLVPLRAVGELPAAVRAVLAGTRLEPATGSADAIVVLGAAVLPNGQPSGSLLARAEAAAALYHQGRAPIVVATGAHHQSPPGEAVVAREILRRAGVPESAILIEEKSRNTYGNFLFARGLIPDAVRVYVVTEPFHLARALLLAKTLGFAEPLPWPAYSPAWGRRPDRWRLLAREMGSMALVRAGA